MRAAYKEPAWKNNRAKEKEAWEREKKRADDAIEEAHRQNKLYNDLRVHCKEYVDAAKKFHETSKKKFLDAMQREAKNSNAMAQLKKDVSAHKAENKALKTKVGTKKGEMDAALVEQRS